VDLNAELKDEKLRLQAFEMRYQQGHLTVESVLDATGPEPAATIKIVAEDVDIDDVLSYLHKPQAVEGKLNMVVDMRSRGKSSKEMATNLNGEFGFAIENGKIQRGVEMIASDALDLLFTAPAQKTYTNLNCMAGRLEFEKGVGTIRVLYMDTPGVRARGAGSIDLGSETIDIVIKPEAKRRLFKRSSPVRIKGELRNPSTKKVPASEAAILAGQLSVPLVALPARALGILWSLVRDDKDEKSPCVEEVLQQTK